VVVVVVVVVVVLFIMTYQHKACTYRRHDMIFSGTYFSISKSHSEQIYEKKTLLNIAECIRRIMVSVRAT